MSIAQSVLAAEPMSDGTFLAYLGALSISGLLLLVMAALPLGSTGVRVINGLIGLAMLGYAFYLFFIFDGGEVRIFFYVFLVPVFLVFRTIQAARARRRASNNPEPAPAEQ